MDATHYIEIKNEPSDSQFDEELNLKQEYDEEAYPNNVNYTNYFEDIKQEFPDSLDVKIETEEHILPDIEISPTFHMHPEDDDGDTAPTSMLRIRQKKMKDDSDEEYIPAESKKKIKQPNAKTVSNPKPKLKTDDQKYSDEITRNIEIVTIDEAERKLEHHALLSNRRHMNYTCEHCAQGYVVEEAYHMHMKIHSVENGEFQCDICHAYVKTADVLYRHKLRHYRRYRCLICLLQLRDKDTVAAHVMREHLGAAFICQHCGRDFKRPQYLKRHMDQMHTKPIHLECPVCGRVFHEKGWYRCHVRTHNEEVRRNIERKAICSHCGREFRNKAYLARHLHTHEDRRTTTCPHCTRSFKNMEVLRVHIRQHHASPKVNKDGSVVPNLAGRTYKGLSREGGPNSNTTCMECGRVLTTRAMLLRHTQRMHTDHTRKFQCDYCKHWYFTKAEVRSHIEWSHMRVRRHACRCGRVFRTPARLRAHVCTLSPRGPAPRDHRCDTCGKMFTTRQVLTRHMKSHSGQTYPCTECGQKFKTQYYVKVHYKLKHLHMTREEIKAQTKRKLIMVDDMDDIMCAKIKKYQPDISSEDPLKVGNEVSIVKKEPDLEVPSFDTFADVPRED